MIIDQLKNIALYKNLTPNLYSTIDYLVKTDLQSLSIGRHEILGDKVFVSINDYMTKEPTEADWEAHKKYIDIQLLLKGEEKIGYTSVTDLELIQEYNQQKDIMFYKGEGQYITLKPGTFALFFPHDAHKPGLISNSKMEVRKVVFKILFETKS